MVLLSEDLEYGCVGLQPETADFVPAGNALVAIREILNSALRGSRYSVPPEWLLRGLLLQALYGIRSERLLCEQLGYNMLYRWFVSLSNGRRSVGPQHLHQEPRSTHCA